MTLKTCEIRLSGDKLANTPKELCKRLHKPAGKIMNYYEITAILQTERPLTGEQVGHRAMSALSMVTLVPCDLNVKDITDRNIAFLKAHGFPVRKCKIREDIIELRNKYPYKPGRKMVWFGKTVQIKSFPIFGTNPTTIMIEDKPKHVFEVPIEDLTLINR